MSGTELLELAMLTQQQVDEAVQAGKDGRTANTIYRIWEDTDIQTSMVKSLTTIKADAAQRSFRGSGRALRGRYSIRASRVRTSISVQQRRTGLDRPRTL
jgi:hypothetical protein